MFMLKGCDSTKEHIHEEENKEKVSDIQRSTSLRD